VDAHYNTYPFFKSVSIILSDKCAVTSSSDYNPDGYLPESYYCHSGYEIGKPGYTIIKKFDGAIPRLQINVYNLEGGLFESVDLTPTLSKETPNL